MRKSSDLTVTDQFCGAGGSSLGAKAAGGNVVLAMNHWKLAVETHNTNFPETLHDCIDISACDPRRYPRTDLLITSPECTNHSLAKGQRRKQQAQLHLWETPKIDPGAERSRATMFDVPRFAEYHQYELIIVENVVEARDWLLFDEWLLIMQKLGYAWEIVYFNSMFAHPTPQSRDRMYIVFWKKGNKAPDLRFTPLAWCLQCSKDVPSIQSWKNPLRKWGRYGKQYIYRCPSCACEVAPYYYAAASAINWHLPIQRIGDRSKPLKLKTLRRVEIGLRRFHEAFLLQANKTTDRVRPVSAVLPTQTADNGLALVSPFLVGLSHGSDSGRVSSVHTRPMQTQTTRQDQALVIPYLVELYRTGTARSAGEPLSTVVAGGNHHGLVLSPALSSSFLVSYYGQDAVHSLGSAMGTVTTRDRHALVTPTEAHPRVEDCSFRMLQPSEIGRAMAFPETYVVLGNKREQTKQYGNAVTPPVMQMIMERCIATFQ
ncbi:MAG TPA: DNA cytosine methyltransferase [Ktedonobacteraceae bacterium]|nr:DNA cytosine methyltransferase [Ktedonobacteraceae bacterium]